jgi:hypothetical protein
MKTLFLGTSAVVMAAIVAAGALAAQRDDRAAVIAGVGDPCAIPGSEADGDLILNGGLGTITSLVERDSRVTLQCRGAGITNESGRGQSYFGFPCLVPTSSGSFETLDSHSTVSPNGTGHLSCTYRP